MNIGGWERMMKSGGSVPRAIQSARGARARGRNQEGNQRQLRTRGQTVSTADGIGAWQAGDSRCIGTTDQAGAVRSSEKRIAVKTVVRPLLVVYYLRIPLQPPESRLYSFYCYAGFFEVVFAVLAVFDSAFARCNAVGLCAASLPLLALSTNNCGLSGDAAT